MDHRIDYEKVAELDIDDVAALDDAGLRRHFDEIAKLATSAQLRTFLTGFPISEDAVDDEDEQERQDLEKAYVERRVDTVHRMLEGANAFDSTFRILEGD